MWWTQNVRGDACGIEKRVSGLADLAIKEVVEDATDVGTISDVRVSPVWGSITALSITFLWITAPGALWLLAFIGVIVLCHEAGHLIAARRAGMEPTEFFWGFGPEIVGFNVGSCRYGLKAIFLGGYVKLHGMTPSSVLPDGIEEAGTYRAASHGGRLTTILAGPFVNLAMAIVSFFFLALLQGRGLGSAVVASFDWLWLVISLTGIALWDLVAQISPYLGAVFDSSAEPPVRFMSPVSQATQTGAAVDAGLAASLQWFGILSAAIGIVNLLPLPPLDGAHAMVAVWERITQKVTRDDTKTVDVRRLEPLAYVTIAFLVMLSLTALLFDVRDLIAA